MKRTILLALAASTLPAIALAQANRPAATVDEAAASRILTDWGFSDIRLDDRKRHHFEFDVRDADGREVEVKVNLDGTLRGFDVDGDRRATSANLTDILPAQLRTVLDERQIADIHEFDTKREGYKVEGYSADGREIEIEIGFDGQLRSFDVDGNGRTAGIDVTDLLPEEVRTVLADRGIVDVHEFETKRHGYKVEGYNADGREIEIEIARGERVGTVSVGSNAQPASGPDLAAITSAVNGAGYVTEGEPVAKSRHVEVLATNPEGEKVTLHTDFSGVVYRETLRR